MLSELDKLHATLSPLGDLESIGVLHFHTHRDLCSVNYLLGFLLIFDNILHLILHIIGDCVSLSLKEEYKASIDHVVVHNFSHFWEVPSKPLLESHAEGVDILIKLVNKSDSLRDWLVSPVHIL